MVQWSDQYTINEVNVAEIPRKSLPNIIASRIAAQILDGTYKSGYQLPAERDLIKQFGVSRSTLREALISLEEINLIESRHGVGRFISELSDKNIAEAHKLAKDEDAQSTVSKVKLTSEDSPEGPRRLPVAPDKPLVIPNLKKDRFGTFSFISWWEREKVEKAKVMVVGAGALGNEVIKNLTLMGVGYIFIVDFDTIELANLSRSVLFRESDSGRKKAEVAAARAKELNPNVHVQYFHGDITTALGLGVFRRMDVIVGCLDNREARLAVNRFSYWINKPWVDGAIQEFLGLARVFVPGEGACFECTLTEIARRDLSIRYSCPLLARENILLGKVPTTPTIASIIAGIQSQEALKIIHDKPIDPGRVIHFNGMTNEVHSTAYTPLEECESHWTYGDITELPLRVDSTTLDNIIEIARRDLGPEAVVELDQELIISLSCPQCGTREEVLQPISEVGFNRAHCPTCGLLRETEMTHTIQGNEKFLSRTLASIGVPPLHILRAYNAEEYRFYEMNGDLSDALHFNHFERPASEAPIKLTGRIKLKERVMQKRRAKITLHQTEGKIGDQKQKHAVKIKLGDQKDEPDEQSEQLVKIEYDEGHEEIDQQPGKSIKIHVTDEGDVAEEPKKDSIKIKFGDQKEEVDEKKEKPIKIKSGDQKENIEEKSDQPIKMEIDDQSEGKGLQPKKSIKLKDDGNTEDKAST
jgi:adenylyltransferase/sulfurtransferase